MRNGPVVTSSEAGKYATAVYVIWHLVSGTVFIYQYQLPPGMYHVPCYVGMRVQFELCL